MTPIPNSSATVALGLLSVVLSATHVAQAAGPPVTVPVLEREAVPACGTTGSSVYVSNLYGRDRGELLAGRSQASLAAGRYRLHVSLAIAPAGHLLTETVAILIEVGGKSRTVSPAELGGTDRFRDFTVDFSLPRASSVPVRIGWMVPEENEDKRDRADEAPGLPGSQTVESAPDLLLQDGDGDDMELGLGDLMDRDAFAAWDDAVQVPYRLLARPPFLEALCPASVTAVQTDRIVYRPGQTGQVTVVVGNVATEPLAARLRVVQRHGLEGSRVLCEGPVTLHGAGDTAWTGTVETADLYWGGDIIAELDVDGYATETGHCVYGVADNFWELAIMTSHQNLGLRGGGEMDLESARAAIGKARDQGFTGFEAFFWAPCDMIDFTPDDEVFFGCQGGSRYTVSGTRHLIQAAHELGMAATVYANLWGAGGPAGMELMRRHPDWFGQAEFKTYYLDDWELMAQGRLASPGIWLHNQVDVARGGAVFDRHIEEVIAGHKVFGWDGTRYDSYYSGPWTKRVTARVREVVEAVVPGYRWGYNSITVLDDRQNALDLMVGGGGLVMEEGLGVRVVTGTTLGEYALKLAAMRDTVWLHEGHMGIVHRRDSDDENCSPLDGVHLSSVLLACGAHPYYTPLEQEIGAHADFALRYSAFIWDHNMRPLADPEATVRMASAESFLHWDKLARELDMGEGRHRLVVHLLNLDASYAMARAGSAAAPPVSRRVPFEIDLPSGAEPVGVWELSAVPRASHRRIPHGMAGGTVTFTVDEVRFWTVVVVEYRGGGAASGGR